MSEENVEIIRRLYRANWEANVITKGGQSRTSVDPVRRKWIHRPASRSAKDLVRGAGEHHPVSSDDRRTTCSKTSGKTFERDLVTRAIMCTRKSSFESRGSGLPAARRSSFESRHLNGRYSNGVISHVDEGYRDPR